LRERFERVRESHIKPILRAYLDITSQAIFNGGVLALLEVLTKVPGP
jgi:hypothetical protein